MADKSKVVIIVLAILVVVLAIVVLYSFVIQQAIQGYNVQRQTEGMQIAVNSILLQLQQQGFVQIPMGEGQQPLVLVPYTPPQQQLIQ